MPHPLEPVERVAFVDECTSQACKSAITNLNNAQRAVSNLLIARTRTMHRNKYETNYAPVEKK